MNTLNDNTATPCARRLIHLATPAPKPCGVCGWPLQVPGEALRIEIGLVHVSCGDAESASTRGGA